MTTVYTARALRITEVGDDRDIFQDIVTLRISTDDITFLVQEDGPSNLFNDTFQVGQEEFTIGAVSAVELRFIEGVAVNRAVYVSFDVGESGDTSFVVLAEGTPLPDPPPGSDVDTFLNSLSATETPLGNILDSPFREGEMVEFQDIEGLNLVGEGATVARAQRVAYLYEAGLDRDGNIDLPGLNFWIDRAEDGLTNRQIAQAFIDSLEFEESFGDPDTLNDFSFVTVLYENVLDRTADDAGRNFWLSVLQQPDVDRAQLLLAFADSNENRTASAFVQNLEESDPGVWDFG
ncbi:MAG: DUF4214 domain-containing protein [Pseudomonadota bacterium]